MDQGVFAISEASNAHLVVKDSFFTSGAFMNVSEGLENVYEENLDTWLQSDVHGPGFQYETNADILVLPWNSGFKKNVEVMC